jgi:hypothetical protein
MQIGKREAREQREERSYSERRVERERGGCQEEEN